MRPRSLAWPLTPPSLPRREGLSAQAGASRPTPRGSNGRGDSSRRDRSGQVTRTHPWEREPSGRAALAIRLVRRHELASLMPGEDETAQVVLGPQVGGDFPLAIAAPAQAQGEVAGNRD